MTPVDLGLVGPRSGRRLDVRRVALAVVALVATLLAGCGAPSVSNPGLQPRSATSDWRMFGYDPARSGVNPTDTRLSTSNVGQLTKLWQARLPGVADSSPILLHGLPFPGGARDVLYVTTRDGRLLALDASDGSMLWSQQPQGPKITHSSPVADLARQYVYAYGLDGALHRYNPTSGAEVKGGGWPAPITRMTQTEKQGSALNLANGRIYVTTGGYIGDAPPYQGHVVSIEPSTGAEHVFNSLCSNLPRLLVASDCASQMSGIWSRGGAVIDPVTGDVWADTGNGPFDANRGGYDYGDSILRLSPDGSTLLDSFTPANYQRLADNDTDLGSSAPALLPRISDSATPLMLVQAGKDGILRLINRQDMSGQGGPGHVGGELQSLDLGCGLYTQPTVWTQSGTDRVWVFLGTSCGMRAYQFTTGADHVSRLEEVWQNGDGATTPVIAGGVLVAAGSGAVRAYDPVTGRTLWSSDQASANGTIGPIHWESPIVVDGAVYITDENGLITCYGLPG
ncbi:MAG TPA: PQQ-binding-like beta-propeller repeat protein [Ktedonobacterales bacterium]|nr:PQQ-binding-like beta-propeller repeat protein [Ktedonobacterales bacterium]